jgi:hypothetical protein
LLAPYMHHEYTCAMPYEPAGRPPTQDDTPAPDAPTGTPSGPTAARFAAIAAIFCLFLAFFNLVMTLPLGVPPEFPLFLALAAIAGGVWWVARPGHRTRRPTRER